MLLQLHCGRCIRIYKINLVLTQRYHQRASVFFCVHVLHAKKKKTKRRRPAPLSNNGDSSAQWPFIVMSLARKSMVTM